MGALAMIKRVVPGPIKRSLRSWVSSTPVCAPVSVGYERISPADLPRVVAELDGAWRNPGIPATQLELVDSELGRFSRGEPLPVFDVFLDLLGRVPGIQKDIEDRQIEK